MSTESGASPRSVPGSGRGDRRGEEEVRAWGRWGRCSSQAEAVKREDYGGHRVEM